MTSLETCETLKRLASELPAQELPRFLGELETAKAIAFSRLTALAPQPTPADMLLDVNQAAERLGVSPSYLYRHHAQFSFTRHVGRALRFSAQGIEKHIQK